MKHGHKRTMQCINRKNNTQQEAQQTKHAHMHKLKTNINKHNKQAKDGHHHPDDHLELSSVFVTRHVVEHIYMLILFTLTDMTFSIIFIVFAASTSESR